MARIGLVVNHRRREAAALAVEVARWLASRGHEARLPEEDAQAVGLADHGFDDAALVDDLDLMVALGGDGTILRAVDLVLPHGCPVLGVNLGSLGYLAGVEPGALIGALERFLAGDFGIEERMALAVDVERASATGIQPRLATDHWALNEVALERPSPGRTVHMAVSIDGRPWTTYVADGLIVSSPTGSTAYAFSARGPILSPHLRALLMTPVSPHMPFDRSLVLDPSEPVRIELTDDRPAVLVVDGRAAGMLEAGDAVVCTAAPRTARFVVFGSRDFYGILKAKFGVADR